MQVQGYDTVHLAVSANEFHVPSEWFTVHKENAEKGHSEHYRNFEGLQVTKKVFRDLPDRCETVFNTSLPKLLWGTNARDCYGPHVEAAVRTLDSLVQSLLPGAPPVRGMTLRRIDVTNDIVLPSPGGVVRALRRIGQREFNGRRPIIGQDFSCTWPSSRGGFKRMVYDKLVESNEVLAAGRLRVEVWAIGQRAIKKAMGLSEDASSGQVTLGQVLANRDFQSAVLAGFPSFVESCVGEVFGMASEDFLKALMGTHGFRKAVKLYGYARAAYDLGGWPELRSEGDKQNIYRARVDIKAAGVDPDELEAIFGVRRSSRRVSTAR